MKKNRLLFRITLILAALAAYLYFTKNPWTIKKELRDFAISDTASVTKIFLADKTGNQITLEKNNPGKWTVNGKYAARNEAVNILLFTMMRLQVKNPVAKAGVESVLKHMSANATKVEIYHNQSLTKTYYVGGATQDQLGTFMLLENSSAPFVMHLPGLNGYLTTRYFTDENQWKSRVIFNIRLDELPEISVTYPDTSAKSFVISWNSQTNGFVIAGEHKKEKLPVTDTLKAIKFYTAFTNLQYEIVVSGISAHKKDSVMKSTPLCIIEVNKPAGETTRLKLFLLPANEHSLMKSDEEGNPLKYDVDRMYGLVDEKELVIVQHYVFDKVMLGFGDFMKR